MSETTEKLVGIKQVLLPEFKAAEEAGTTKGYMWFVRDNNITLHNYIYLGSRLYGEAEIEVPFDSVITNILSDNSIVVTKTSSEEGTTVELKINLDPNGGLTLTENGLQVDMSKFISQSELDKVKDDIKTVNDNLVTSINAINQNVADGFNTINGGIENEIKPAIAEAKKLAVDETERALTAETNLQTNINVETTERKIDVANLQGNINIETERALAAEAALAEKVKEVDVDEIKADIKTVNDNLVTAVNTINQNMADGFNTINGGIDNEIRPELAKAVKYQEFDTNRKTIQLANFDTLSGIMTDGEGVNLAMVSKWDKADFGSTKLPFNMNGSEERPTYNDTKEVALMDDINSEITNESDRVNAMIDVINESIKTVNDNLVDAVNTINGGIDNEIRPAIEDLKENKVSYVEAEKEGKKYKVIQLDNYANLVGEGTDELSGQTFNIGMVSKWNKVDLGSASLEINLNGKVNRPTYNDTKEIALIEDVNGKISSVELVQDVDNQLHYELMVDGVVKGDINIPKDQFLKNVEYDDTTKELVFTFDTTDGEKVTKVNIGELVDTYEAGNGLELNGNIFSIKLDPSSQSYIQVTSDGIKIIAIDEAISEINGKITAEETRASGVEAKLRTDVDYEHERALEAEANINNALETKVTWDESKSKIVLPSGGQIVGTKYGTDGSNPADGATIAQLSQYDIMDFGSSKYPLNLNVPAGVRVTVQEQGQSGENANKVAYLSDVEDKVPYAEVDGQKVIQFANNSGIYGTDTINGGQPLQIIGMNGNNPVIGNTETNLTLKTADHTRPYVMIGNNLKYMVVEDNANDIVDSINNKLDIETYDNDKSTFALNDDLQMFYKFKNYTNTLSGLNGNKLFALTTTSTNAEIMDALSYYGPEKLTVDDLDKCVSKGWVLREANTGAHIVVGWFGSYYTLSSLVKRYNNTSLMSIYSISLQYENGQWKVINDGTRTLIPSNNGITDLNKALDAKVDKVDDMGLSQENFTTALKTKLEGLSNYDDTAINASIEENKTNIADVRSDLTAESTLQATNYNDLNTRLNSEVTRATDRENEIETKIDNILSTGLTLPNNESISARPTGSTTSPVNILTLTSGNVVEVGSNIGNLSLKSKGSPVISINDGVAKEIALKEQIDALQTTINSLIERIEALEAKNP